MRYNKFTIKHSPCLVKFEVKLDDGNKVSKMKSSFLPSKF